jgi:hypothetical protein
MYMFQKGRGEQAIKHKEEVLKKHPDAMWYGVSINGGRPEGAIMVGRNRVSEVYRVAWKAWEDAYWRLIENKEVPGEIKWTY